MLLGERVQGTGKTEAAKRKAEAKEPLARQVAEGGSEKQQPKRRQQLNGAAKGGS